MTAPVAAGGTQRRAPVAAGTGVAVDGHEAYRRGLCRDCRTVWHSPGRTRCDDCHENYCGGGVSERTRVPPRGEEGPGQHDHDS